MSEEDFINLDDITEAIDEELILEDEEETWIPEKQKKTLYLYELKKLFKQKENSLITFSPNSVNFLIIEKNEYVTINGWVPEADNFEYFNKQSMSNIDNELEVAQKSEKTFYSYIDIQGSVNFKNGKTFIYQKNRIYFISPIPITNDEDILNFGYFVNSLSYEMGLTDTRFGKKIFKLVDLEAWTTKDGNQAIIRLGTPLANDINIESIKIDAPSSFLLESFKVLGTDGLFKDVNLNTSMINLWLNPIESLFSGEINFLNFWMSERILPYGKIKDYLRTDGVDLSKLLVLDDDDDPPATEITRNYTNITKIDSQVMDIQFDSVFDGQSHINKEAFKGLQKIILEPKKNGIDYINFLPTWNGKKFVKINFFRTNQEDNLSYYSRVEFNNFGTVSITFSEEIKYSSLYKLLIEILNASYNYNNNFKGAGYLNDNPQEGLNKMALYKQEFEGKTIIEYVDGLEKNWEKKYPNLTNSQAYKNYLMIRNMLSGYIYGTNSISGGSNDDYKALMPYYFKLITKPTWEGATGGKEDDGTGKWEYSTTLLVKIESMYFNFDENGNISSLKNTNISKKEIMNLNINSSWIWSSISDTINETSLPSLNSSDFKLSDDNVGKFLVFAPDNLKKYLGTNNNKLKIDMNDVIKMNADSRNLIEFTIQKLSNIKQLKISGIYGSGNWNINLVLADKSEILLKNLTIFKINKQNIANISIQF